jgi:hypothetical protein
MMGKTANGTAQREFAEKPALYFQWWQLGHCPKKGRKGQIGTQMMKPFLKFFS